MSAGEWRRSIMTNTAHYIHTGQQRPACGHPHNAAAWPTAADWVRHCGQCERHLNRIAPMRATFPAAHRPKPTPQPTGYVGRDPLIDTIHAYTRNAA